VSLVFPLFLRGRGEVFSELGPATLLPLFPLSLALSLLCVFLIGTFAVYTFWAVVGLLRPPSLEFLELGKGGENGGGSSKAKRNGSPRHSSSFSASSSSSSTLLLNQELLDRQLQGLDLALELRPLVGRHGARDDLLV
jgi:hypothetical protein